MINYLKTLFFLLLVTSSLHAQTFQISGTITDETDTPLAGAGVSLLNDNDSMLLKSAISDSAGSFIFSELQSKSYLLKATFVGFKTLYKMVSISSNDIHLKKIKLVPGASTLGTAQVEDKMPTANIKGDTTEINAGAFKTNPDASADDLIKKMPGITLVDGKVQAQGEDVKKVLVDGKPFFGDDPNAVLKNLPADVIEKIQVFDKRSDQSQFTGFDDGNSSKTINIITKAQFRNGIFGKATAGVGYEDKWKAGLALNFFKDKRRITILANSNNINEQNFSADDLLGVVSSSGGSSRGQGMPRGNFGGQGGPRGGRSGGSQSGEGNFLTDQKNGLTTTNSIGLNYSDKWNKTEVTFSYFFNSTNNQLVSNSYRQYVTDPNVGLTYDEDKNNKLDNINHRANFKIEWKIDSMNSFLFQPRLVYQQSNSNNNLFGQNEVDTILVSNTANNTSSDLNAINTAIPILYRHSFAKKGRTFSLNTTPGYNNNLGNTTLLSYDNYYTDTLTNDTIQQLSNLNKDGFVNSSSVNYTEPLNSKSQLMFNYGINYNKNVSDKITNEYSVEDELYNNFDSLLSNKFNSTYIAHSAGLSYRYGVEKWNINAGFNYQYAQLNNEQVFPSEYNLSRSFNSILPSVMFTYQITPKKSFRLNYRSSNNAPTVDQLQEVINNSNPLQLSTGNDELNQDWQNNLFMRYSAVNTDKSTAFFAMLGASLTQDFIANSTYIAPADTVVDNKFVLQAGSQLNRPVNLNSYYNLRAFINYSFPINKLKSKLNLNLGSYYTHTPGLINFETNYANSSNSNLGVSLTSNISEKIDFTVGYNGNYSDIKNTLQKELDSRYVNQTVSIKTQVNPWSGLVFQTDFNASKYSGLSDSYNELYYLWNAAIGYKFLKDRLAELRFSVFDILNQNRSITRNTSDTYYEDVKTNVLQRYYMLTFTYNLKFFNEKPKTP